MSGKTTLANLIRQKYGSRIVHLGVPAHGKRHWDELRESLNAQPNNNVVFDRACLGSIVYGKIKQDEGNKYPVTYEELASFLKYARQNELLFIHARAHVKTIAERYDIRGDSYLSLEQILFAREEYEDLFTDVALTCHVIEYNSTLISASDFVNRWFSFMNTALYSNRSIHFAEGLFR